MEKIYFYTVLFGFVLFFAWSFDLDRKLNRIIELLERRNSN